MTNHNARKVTVVKPTGSDCEVTPNSFTKPPMIVYHFMICRGISSI